MKQSAELEQLAKACVGDGRTNLSFVTVGGKVRAVFVGRHDDALDYAQSIQGNESIVLEDRTGVVWESY